MSVASDAGSGEPFVRRAGDAGPGVVCLHSNASSSGQWSALLAQLAPRFRAFAPDTLGAGRSPRWPQDRAVTLADEAALLAPVLAEAGTPLALVGHSYGAAIALRIALERPGSVRALALYEPTLFAVLEQEQPNHPEADGIRDAVMDAGRALDAGDAEGAAERFIDYWTGEGSWQRVPEARRAPMAAMVQNVRGWWHALSTEPTPLAAFAALDIPVLYLVGSDTRASARGVARRLAAVLPRVQLVELPGAGHMGPVTHADAVNAAIERFLLAHHAGDAGG